MKNVKISETTHSKLKNAKIVFEVVSFDKVIDIICSKSNLYFLKNYNGNNEEDIRNYIAGLFENSNKYFQKQMGRPMARFADFEKMYWHRLVYLDNDFKNLNFKLDTILRVAKKEIGIQPNDEVEDFQTSIEQKNLSDRLEAKEIEKQRRMLQLSYSTNTELQDKIRELYTKINIILPKFKKKESLLMGKKQCELTLSQEEYDDFISAIRGWRKIEELGKFIRIYLF